MPVSGTVEYLTPVTRLKQRSDAGRWLLVAATASCAFTVINSVILILLATELDDSLLGPRTVCIIALVFQLISAVIIARLAYRERRRRTGYAGIFKKTEGQRKRDIAIAAAVVGLGQVLTLFAIIWVQVDVQNPMYNVGGTPVSISIVLIVSWVMSLIFEAATFFLTFPNSPRRRERKDRPCNLDTQAARPNLSPTQFDSPQYPPSNPFSSKQQTPAHSPTLKTNSMISLRSLVLPRGAPAHVSASIRRSMSIGSSARATPSPRQSSESAFDTWDTSSVPPEMRAAMSNSGSLSPTNLHTTIRPTSGRTNHSHPRLPPIPGSRPASPAKPLEGPFPSPNSNVTNRQEDLENSDESTPLSPPLYIAADVADLPPSPTIHNLGFPFPLTHALTPKNSASSLRAPPSIHALPNILSSSTSLESLHSITPRPSFARRPSITSHASVESFNHLRNVPANVPEAESQIHPLFRMTSPEPAPGITRGTVLTAAPVELSESSGASGLGITTSVDRARPGRSGSLVQAGSASIAPASSRSRSRPASSSASQNGGAGVSALANAAAPPIPCSSPLIREFPRDSAIEPGDVASREPEEPSRRNVQQGSRQDERHQDNNERI